MKNKNKNVCQRSPENPEGASLPRAGLYRALANMCAFLAVVFLLSLLSARELLPMWRAGRLLNALILFVFAAGVAANMAKVVALARAASWADSFLKAREVPPPPAVLSPVAFQLSQARKTSRGYMDIASMQRLLSMVRERLAQEGTLAKYLAGILVFLGLLGTFWGLMLALGSAGGIVRGSGGLEAIRTSLLRPMGGMGAAFSTSLFGLAGSLVLGFLGLQRELASAWFYRGLEENLMKYARPAQDGAGGPGAGALSYLGAMLEQTADNLNQMQRLIGRQVDAGEEASAKMAALAHSVSALASQMERKLKALERISAAPEKLYSTLSDLVKISRSGFGLDDKTREHIRSMDYRIAEMTERLSADLRLLAKAGKADDGKR